MFAGFNLKLDANAFSNNLTYVPVEKKIQEQKRTISKSLLDLFLSKTIIDAEAVEKALFPSSSDYDVFLSHSYGDITLATRLGAVLQSIGLKVFIDSHVWGSVYDLLKAIDDKYCLNPGGETYSYEKRNRSTAHVYIILNSALQKMIDKAEAFIFLNTGDSITRVSMNVFVEASDEEKTYSPWIHSELQFSALTEKREPERFKKKPRPVLLHEAQGFIAKSMGDLKIAHHAPLDQLYRLQEKQVTKWVIDVSASGSARTEHPLDKLYQIVSL